MKQNEKEKNKIVQQYEELYIHIKMLVAEMKTELLDQVIESKFNEK